MKASVAVLAGGKAMGFLRYRWVGCPSPIVQGKGWVNKADISQPSLVSFPLLEHLQGSFSILLLW